MIYKEWSYNDTTGTIINGYKYIPDKPVAILQIVHGMMEHAWRYRAFAEWISNRGIAVYANDHRGHGRNINTEDELGYFAKNDG